MRLRMILVLALLAAKSLVSAQYFSTGEDPAAIRWKQIQTTNFQLIFPSGYAQKALKLAGLMEKVYQHGGQTLGHRPKKISLILHTHTVTSNGMVAWSPKRMEFYTTPNQQLYAQDWLEQLAIHEFRHVVQMDKIQSELPAIFRILFGEHAAAAVVAAYLPFWFIEGDAVITETALTHTGRGRLPAFLMENKAQLVEKGLFPYDKASLGSFRDFVPNRYHFGYWFTGAVRRQYGADIWPDVLREIAGKPLSLNPLNRTLKRRTGFRKEELYENIFRDYATEWKREVDSLKTSGYRNSSPPPRTYTNYRYLSALSDSSLIALRERRNDVDRIVRIVSGKETVLFTPGYIPGESLSVTDSLIIWAEQRPDIRWAHAGSAVIVLYEIRTGKKKEFRYRNHVLSPVIAPDGKTFAAVETDFANNYQIGLYDVGTGAKIKGYATPDNHYFFTPVWGPSSKILYFAGLSPTGKYLGALHPESGNFERLTRPGYVDLRNPEVRDDKLYYVSAMTGTDNIFCLDLSSGRTTKVTNVPFGADYPAVSGNQLFFSNYSADGYAVAVQELDESRAIPAESLTAATYPLADSLAAHEDTVPDLNAPAYGEDQIKPYRKLGHLFNFHSRAPLFIDVNDYAIKPGVSFLSQNKLGTAHTLLGYEQDPAERSGKYRAELEYSGLFPVFRTGFSYGRRRSTYYTVEGRDTIRHPYSWKELTWNLDVRVPLSFSQGKYSQFFQPEIKYDYEKIMQKATTHPDIYEGFYHSLDYRLYFQNVIRKAELDLLPEWGQTLDLTYRHSLGGGTPVGDLKAAEINLYVPGLSRTHGIRFYNGYQVKNTDTRFTFSDVVRFPRGFDRLQNEELYTFGADYMLPLCYPDLILGPLYYLKRLRTSLFYDFSRLESTLYDNQGRKQGIITTKLNALGAELRGDGHLLRFIAPVSAGLRGTYRPDYDDFRIEFLLTVNFDFQ